MTAFRDFKHLLEQMMRRNARHASGKVVQQRAELIGSNGASALGVEAHGPSPVLALCRALIEAGHDPATPLHAYRGHTLALKVRSIGEGAKLTVGDNDIGKSVFRRWRDRAESSGAASPMHQNLETASDPPMDPSRSERRGAASV